MGQATPPADDADEDDLVRHWQGEMQEGAEGCLEAEKMAHYRDCSCAMLPSCERWRSCWYHDEEDILGMAVCTHMRYQGSSPSLTWLVT